MILPAGTPVAVTDGETVRLSQYGREAWGAFGRNHGGSGSGARRHTGSSNDGCVPEQAQPGRDHLVVVSDPGPCGRCASTSTAT
jgi:hypothetical protein